MALKRETIEFGDTRIAFTVRRSERRKTIGISVKADGNVEVAAPRGVSSHRIAEAVRRKSGWIIGKQEESRQFLKASPAGLVSGESIRYLGRQHQLKLIPDEGTAVRLKITAGRAELRVPRDWTGKERAAAGKKALQDWYGSRLGKIVVPITDRYAGQIGEAISGIRIRELGRRWGSCGKSRFLNFNWRLAMAPKPLIEFVVAHEVCHLRHADHSPDFFRLLTRIQPDWETRRERLDREGARYEL